MDQPGTYPTFVPAMGIDNHTVHPWVQAQQVQRPGEYIQRPEEQGLPSMIPSYVSQINTPSASYTQNRVVNYNYEAIVCEQRTGFGSINSSCQLTIPIELLDEEFIQHQALPAVGLKEIVFLGPHPNWAQYFLHSRDVFIMRAIHVLEIVQSLKKVTFSLDLMTHLRGILETLAAISDMEEIVLTLPTAFRLQRDSIEMVNAQNAFVDGLKSFGRLNRLTIPMELLTAFLLSFLAELPCLESLTVNSSPPSGPSHQHPFPVWSSYRDQEECPGHIFLNYLNAVDPRNHFKQLSRLELGAQLSDSSYATLKVLFPKAHIC